MLCGTNKTSDHIAHCPKATNLFMQRPNQPFQPPTNRKVGFNYIFSLLKSPQDFEVFLHLSEYYRKLCKC